MSLSPFKMEKLKGNNGSCLCVLKETPDMNSHTREQRQGLLPQQETHTGTAPTTEPILPSSNHRVPVSSSTAWGCRGTMKPGCY